MEGMVVPRIPGKVQQVFRCKYCGRNYMKADELIAHKKLTHKAEIIATRKRESLANSKNSACTGTGDSITTATPQSSNTTQSSNGGEVSQEETDLNNSETSVFKSPVKQDAATTVTNEDEESSEDDSETSSKSSSSATPAGVTPIINRVNGTLHPSPSPYLKASSDGFQCPVCNETFNYDYQLMEHMTSHDHSEKSVTPQSSVTHTTPPFVVANEVLPEQTRILMKSYKRKARRLVNQLRRYRCPHCFKKFQRSTKLTAHVKESHQVPPVPAAPAPSTQLNSTSDERPPTDRIENTPFSTPLPVISPHGEYGDNLVGGKRRSSYPRPNTKSFKCRKCNFSCRFRSSLVRHQNSHEGPQVYTCEVCHGPFKSVFTKLLHIRTVHPAEAKPSRRRPHVSDNDEGEAAENSRSEEQKPHSRDCQDCGATFLTLKALTSHSQLLHGKGAYRCTYCPYATISTGNLKAHVARLHMNKYGPEHQCEYCGGTCHSQGSLQQHIKLVHNSKETKRKVITTTATTKTTQPHKEILPEKFHYGRKKTFGCSECPYRAYNLADVNRHMRNIHTVKRRYQCEVCSASYDGFRHFEIHQALHSSDGTGSKVQSRLKTESPTRVVGWKNTRKISKMDMEEEMPTDSEPMGEDPEHEATVDDSWNAKTSDLVKAHRCRGCEIAFITHADYRRHCRTQIHNYNEELRRMQRQGDRGRPASFRQIRHKIECDQCMLLFISHRRLHAHFMKKHPNVLNLDEAFFPTKRAKPSSRPTLPKRSRREKLEETEAGVESEDDSSYTIPNSEETEQSNEIRGNGRTVTVTQQQSFGLKITTVRYGS